MKVIWCPAHAGLPGNEKADKLAKQGARSAFVGPGPALPICRTSVKNFFNSWLDRKFSSGWSMRGGLTQSRLLTERPSSVPEVKKLLALEREQLSLVTGAMTGHLFNKHLNRMGLTSCSLCRWCRSTEETVEHILFFCINLEDLRMTHLGNRTPTAPMVRETPLCRLVAFLSACHRV